MATGSIARGLLCWTLIVLSGLCGGLNHDATAAQPDAASQPSGLGRPADALWDLERAFRLEPLVRAGYVSSYDRTGGNDDGFKGTYSALYPLANGEQVIVDLEGPGCLRTLWFTGIAGGYELPFSQLRFYLDGEDRPRATCAGKDLFAGGIPAFPRPLVANSFTSTGGDVSYVPVPFQKRLIVTTDKRATFYNAFYDLYPYGTRVESWTGREDLSGAVRAWNAAGSEPGAAAASTWHRGLVQVPGSTHRNQPGVCEILNLDSPGCVVALRLNPERPLSATALNGLWLRAWFDDEETPSVDVPVGPFFGSALGEAAVRSLPIGMSPSGPYYCHLPMPFERSIRLALENRHFDPVGGVYYEAAIAPLEEAAQLPRQGRFAAVYRQERPTAVGRDYHILELDHGQGVYVGHSLIVQPYDADNKKWWEGDLRIWVDQRRHPILQGTGHEDEFLGGWSSRWLQGPHTLPLHGLPSVTLFPERADSQWNGAITAYRFFVGGIPFRDGIRVSTEHGTNNDVVTNYGSVAYYYRLPESGMTLTDSLDVADDASISSHHCAARQGDATGPITASFDGDDTTAEARLHVASGRRGQRLETFTLKIAPRNQGVMLRRLYLQSSGRHRARLSVDGVSVGYVGTPDDHRVDRWREEDVMLSPSLTEGKESLTVRIEVEEGTWNAFRYSTYSCGRP